MTTFFYLKMNGSVHFGNGSPAICYNLFQTSVMRRNEASVSWVAAKQYFQGTANQKYFRCCRVYQNWLPIT